MRRYWSVLLAALTAACITNPPKPPTPPAPLVRTVSIATVPAVESASVTLNVDGRNRDTLKTDNNGYAAWNGVTDCTPQHRPVLTVHIDAAGYQVVDAGPYGASCGNAPLMQTLIALPPPFLNAGESGVLSLTGSQWTNAGQGWTWDGCSDFALFQKYLHGDDLTPTLDSRVGAQAQRCKLLRVFGQFVGSSDPNDQGIGTNSGLGHLVPAATDAYYARLSDFADLLALHGLRFEFTALADNQIIKTNASTHLAAVCDALRGKWNIAGIEIENEPFKNGNDSSIAIPSQCAGFSIATGDTTIDWTRSDAGGFLWRNYITWHGDRGDEWPRGPRGLSEIRDGASSWGGAHVAVIADEPMGAAEVDQPGRRSAIPDDFRFFGALSKLFGAGATFHSDDGIGSVPFGPVTSALADAFFEGLNWAPWSAQFGAYQRGDPGSAEGIGNMPLLHHDLNTGFPDEALRTFCKLADGFEWCVAVRPSAGWHATPLRGCVVVQEPWKGFVKLSCPVQ